MVAETTLLDGAEQAATPAAPAEQSPQTPDTGAVTEGDKPNPPGWIAGLRTEQKSNEYFSKFTKVSEFADEALGMKERLEKSLLMPDDNASEQDRNEFYQKLGRPESAEKYTLPDKVGDFAVPKEFKEQFSVLAFGANLTNSQATDLFENYAKNYQQTMESAAESYRVQLEDGEKALKKEWRGDYSANLDIAKRGYKEFADDEIRKIFKESGIGNHPAVLKFFHRVGSKIIGDKSIHGEAPAQKKSEYVTNYKPMR